MSLDPFSMWLTNFAAVLAKEPEHAETCPVRSPFKCGKCQGKGEIAGFDPHVAVPCPECRPGDQHEGWKRCNCDYHPSVLEQRIAIGLIQSRALECRHWADVLIREHRDNPIAVTLARHLARRSHKLEQLGLDLCKEGAWPIKGSTQEPKVKLQ